MTIKREASFDRRTFSTSRRARLPPVHPAKSGDELLTPKDGANDARCGCKGPEP